MSETQSQNPDPRDRGPKPPQPPQGQPVPGTEAEMTPGPDHGEGSYRGSDKLKDRVALITGGDSGIGKAVAIAFAREGADVVISYLNEDGDARDTAKWVEQAGRRALLVSGDVGQEAHCRELVQRTVKEFGRLDVLVSNAAFQMTREHITDIPAEEWHRTLRTNLDAMFYLCREAVPHMKAGAAIITTSSIEAFQPEPFLLSYAMTKGAIVNFTKGLAKMLAGQGIRVNSVAPGPIWTPLIPSTMPHEQVTQFGKQTPLGRAGQPFELAPAYVLLASDDGSYITGAVVPVTGGMPTM